MVQKDQIHPRPPIEVTGFFGDVTLFHLTTQLSEPEGRRSLQRAGFFNGNLDLDRGLIAQMDAVIGDEAKFLPTLLDAVHQSRGISYINLAQQYPDLTPQQIRERIQQAEIPDPYSLREIEDALRSSVMPEIPSITVFGGELRIKPDWWDEHLPDFREKVLSQYLRLPPAPNQIS